MTDRVQQAIDAFNADASKTRSFHPDSREHRWARRPILAEDCDYEIVGFSGVQGIRLPREENAQ